MNAAIELRNLHKVYRRYGRRSNFGTLKSALLGGRVLADLRPDATFEALKGISLTVQAGRSVGVIGRNGSGKSTLLKLLAGIGRPTAGTLEVAGRVSALIELGAGFHPEISGRENVFINGMMMGLSKQQMAARFDDIVAFAEIGEFIDAPVKTYSSGMYMRLGFSVAIHVDPDVLLVDEVLAVGDEAFTHKCLDRFAELKLRKKTILLVTHQLDLVTKLCDEAVWLDAGVIRSHGDPKRVVDAYLLDVAARENHAGAPALPPAGDGDTPQDMNAAGKGRWGSREAEITSVAVRRSDGAAAHVFRSGEAMVIALTVHAPLPLRDFVFGVAIFTADGVCCYGTNTQIEGAAPVELNGTAEVVFTIDSLDLVAGMYRLDVAVHRADGMPYDYHRLLHSFRVTSDLKDVGIARPRHRWSFGGGVRIDGLPAEPRQ